MHVQYWCVVYSVAEKMREEERKQHRHDEKESGHDIRRRRGGRCTNRSSVQARERNMERKAGIP